MNSNIEEKILNSKDFSEEAYVDFIKGLDSAYEKGNPLISDDIYDQILTDFSLRFPNSYFLSTIREEDDELSNNLKKVKHTKPMLSTEKAYTKEEVSAWAKKVISSGQEIGIEKEDIFVSITPKLDGMAGRHENGVLATRGNGSEGFDISHIYDVGVKTISGIKDGNGEVVLSKKYFDENLGDIFSHPRNVIVGLVKSDVLSDNSIKTLKDGAAYFYHYSELPSIQIPVEEFGNMDNHYDYLRQELIVNNDFEFPIDGFVACLTNDVLSEYMGYNSHHYHSVIALKEHGEAKDVKILGGILQTGRTGRITPVVLLEPTLISGAMVSRVTGHNLSLLRQQGIGEGAVVKVVRSGEVIPYIVSVVKPCEKPFDFNECPSCGEPVVKVSDSVFECINKTSCPAQLVNSIVYHFKTLDVKNFGGKTVEKIINSGKVKSVSDIYKLKKEDYQEMSFGERQSEVLIESISYLFDNNIEGDKLLASFGIRNLGNRASKSILNFYELEELIYSTPEYSSIMKIDNFGEITAKEIVKGISLIREDFRIIRDLGIKFAEKTINKEGVLYGKGIIFTGKMNNRGRKEMESEAESLGAIIQSSVTKKTDILVYGEKAGSKLEKARNLRVECLTEDEYQAMI